MASVAQGGSVSFKVVGKNKHGDVVAVTGVKVVSDDAADVVTVSDDGASGSVVASGVVGSHKLSPSSPGAVGVDSSFDVTADPVVATVEVQFV